MILAGGDCPPCSPGLRLAFGGRLADGGVTAEMIAVKSGLGYMILNAQMTFRPELIFAGIIVIGAIGLLGDQARAGAWRRPAFAAGRRG